jgi:hypothetical protein
VYCFVYFFVYFVYCFSPSVQLSQISVQVRRPLPPDRNPTAVNKYRTITFNITCSSEVSVKALASNLLTNIPVSLQKSSPATLLFPNRPLYLLVIHNYVAIS